jgi:hypothetical protein
MRRTTRCWSGTETDAPGESAWVPTRLVTAPVPRERTRSPRPNLLADEVETSDSLASNNSRPASLEAIRAEYQSTSDGAPAAIGRVLRLEGGASSPETWASDWARAHFA